MLVVFLFLIVAIGGTGIVIGRKFLVQTGTDKAAATEDDDFLFLVLFSQELL